MQIKTIDLGCSSAINMIEDRCSRGVANILVKTSNDNAKILFELMKKIETLESKIEQLEQK